MSLSTLDIVWDVVANKIPSLHRDITRLIQVETADTSGQQEAPSP